MRPLSRLTYYVFGMCFLLGNLVTQAQQLKLDAGFSLTYEMTTGFSADKNQDLMNIVNQARATYKPELHLRLGILKYVEIEGGFYVKDRGIGGKIAVLDDFDNPIGQITTSSHYNYIGIPLRMRLHWEGLFVSLGPSLELLNGFISYQDGVPVATAFRPSRALEWVLSSQIGWQGRLGKYITGFTALSLDAQWTKALSQDEYRFASIGLTVGLNFQVR